MGGSNSRTITVEQELEQDGQGVVKVSEAVAERLFGEQLASRQRGPRQAPPVGHERGALPRYEGEPWIALLSHLEALRSPLAFDQLLGGDIERVGPNSVWSQEWDTNTAICDTVMRAGRHYATFFKEGFGRMNAGIMRPAKGLDRGGYVQFDPLERSCWSPLLERRNDRWGEDDVNCCMYYSTYGTCSWSDWQTETTHGHAWGGSQILLGNGEIGMLLDLDAGSLAVFMDGRRLGTMMEGLSGEYCWAASVWSGTKLTIKRECAPADR